MHSIDISQLIQFLNCRNTHHFDNTKLHDYVDFIKSSTGDHFMAIDDLQFARSNKNESITGVKLLKNQDYRVPLRFASVPGYNLHKVFEAKLMRMHEAGLIEHYKRQYYDPKYFDLMEEEDDPKVLTVEQLSIGFQVFLLFAGVAIVVFVVEIVKFKWQKHQNSKKVFLSLNN